MLSILSILISCYIFFESPTFEVSWVYINYVNCLLENDTFESLNHRLRKAVRLLAERDEDPSAGIVDSQSVKTAETRT